MELGEATRLAGRFITRALFRLHSLPLHDRGRHATLWWERQHSPLPLGDALAEACEHLARFAVRSGVDRASGRSLHLTISALTLDPTPGRCPALVDNRCGVYAERPLTCRTVPLHYSRPLSALPRYLDNFVQTPGYGCATGPDAPPLLNADGIADPTIRAMRAEAVAQARAERAWKGEIARLMDCPDEAAALGLPTYNAVRKNSDAGSASLVPMLAPWRVARRLGLLAPDAFTTLCRQQVDLIRTAMADCTDPDLFASLHPLLAGYEAETARPSAASEALLLTRR